MEPKPTSKSTRWRWIAVAVLVLPAAYALFSLATSTFSSSETIGPVRGVRLGHAPAQARERLATGAPGSFRTVTMGEDFALEWVPDGEPRSLRRARLEFHLGQLVAARLLVSDDAEEASGPPIEVSDASILTRDRGAEGIEITWLARSCPTHAEEVQRRLSERR